MSHFTLLTPYDRKSRRITRWFTRHPLAAWTLAAIVGATPWLVLLYGLASWWTP